MNLKKKLKKKKVKLVRETCRLLKFNQKFSYFMLHRIR
jgi:hypothetical protein